MKIAQNLVLYARNVMYEYNTHHKLLGDELNQLLVASVKNVYIFVYIYSCMCIVFVDIVIC